MRIVFELITAIALFIWSLNIKDEGFKPELEGMALASCIAAAVELMVWVIKERKLLKLYWSSINPFIRSEIRLTIAYLFRIEVNGKYLLVKSNRLNNTFQPVGGVYKYFHPEATLELNQMGIVTDNHIPNDEVNEYDLRLKQDNKWNLRKFLTWFFENKQRETDPWREFYEELIVPNILEKEHFPYIHNELVGQHYDSIHFDERFRINTFKYADIFVPKYINSTQETLMRNLVNVSSENYIWVTEGEIRNNRSNDGHSIAPHSYKIFHNTKLK
jgi:hypothetical protein